MGQGNNRTGRLRLRTLWSIVAIALLLTACSGSKKNEAISVEDIGSGSEVTETPADDPGSTAGSGTDLASLAPSSVDTKVTTNLNLASNAAKAWQPDALLVYVSVELPASLAADSGNEVYVFGSATNRTEWWTYSISQDTRKFVRAIIPKEDFLGSDLVPINTAYWKMNYVEAFQLAEAGGGAEFRASTPGSRVTIFLSQRAPRGWLWWTVEYTAPSGETFTLLVNPNLGEVVDESGTEVAPAQGNTSSSETTDGISTTDEVQSLAN